jgi:2'-5' RNA ligase
MPRLRFAVALLVPDPVATEIDGLRRALGDPGLPNVVPHITLIPPVNIAEQKVDEALGVIRAAAYDTGPMQLRLGPPTTFAPVNPVVYLAVGGDDGAVHELRENLLRGPLARPPTYEFVPHVTLCEDCAPEHLAPALKTLRDFVIDVRIDRLHLLRDHEPGPRRWNPVADVVFERPLVVGAGGLPIEISVSQIADPQVREQFSDESRPDIQPGPFDVVAVARREGAVVAAARGQVDHGQVRFDEVVGDRALEQQLLRAATQSTAGPT